MEVILSARKIAKVYQMGEVKVYALREVDIDLYRGEFLVLLGASGSGKSTLLNILGGLDAPTTGEVNYKGKDLSKASSAELTQFRRNYVGFVFQMYNLIPRLTAAENVSLVTDVSETPMDTSEALQLVGLENRSDHFPSQLSGGEQQRVAIARGIAKKPKILLCDEPTGALDFKTGIRVLEAIAHVNTALGTTTAIITHNASIAHIADRVVRLADGRIIEIIENKHKKEPREIQWYSSLTSRWCVTCFT